MEQAALSLLQVDWKPPRDALLIENGADVQSQRFNYFAAVCRAGGKDRKQKHEQKHLGKTIRVLHVKKATKGQQAAPQAPMMNFSAKQRDILSKLSESR